MEDQIESQDTDSDRIHSPESLRHDPIHEGPQESMDDFHSKSFKAVQALSKAEKEFSWELLWTSKAFLLFLAVIFLFMMATTLSLLLFSQKHNGIASQKQENYYAWRYGPTGVLVFVNALWRQVDYATKALVPWQELQLGSPSVEQTLLLDYVNLSLPIGLWKSAKNRHWAVTLTMCGQLLIVTVIGISTSLLVLEPRNITQSRHDFRLRGKIRLASDWIDLSWTSGAWPAVKHYGIRALGMPYPNGTSADIITPDVELPYLSFPLLHSTTEVEGLRVKLSCQILPFHNASDLNLTTYGQQRKLLADINTTDCFIEGAVVASSVSVLLNDSVTSIDGYNSQAYTTHAETVRCNSSYAVWGREQEAYRNSTRTKIDGRILLSLTDWRWDPSTLSSYAEFPAKSYINKMTAILCKPSHELGSFRLQTLRGGNQPPTMAPVSEMKQLQGLSDAHLAQAVLRSLDFFESGTPNLSTEKFDRSGFVVMMVKQDGIGASLLDLDKPSKLVEDPRTFAKIAEELFSGVAIQLLRDLVIQPSNYAHSGNITLTEDRLVVAALPAKMMCASLVLLTMIAMSLSFMCLRTSIPFRFGSVFAIAVILSHRPDLSKGHTPPALTHITGIRNSIAIPGFSQAFHQKLPGSRMKVSVQQGEAKKEIESMTWWRPAPSTSWFLSLAASLPLLSIALLEIIQQRSNKNAGFADFVPGKTSILTTYVPTTVALCIANIFSSLELTVSMFAPFLTLKKGCAPAVQSINLKFVGRPWPHAAYLAMKSRNLTMLAVLPTSLISGLLAMIMSGLYSTVDVPRNEMTTLIATDRLVLDDSSMFGSSYENNRDVYERVTLLEYIGIDDIQGSFENLVFNSFKQSRLSVDFEPTAGTILVEVPAVRPRLNCTPISNPGEVIVGESYSNATDSNNKRFSIRIRLSPRDWCEGYPRDPEMPVNSMSLEVPLNGTTVLFGQADELAWNVYPEADQVWGCPGLVLSSGQARILSLNAGKGIPPSLNISHGTMVCYQNMEMVKTKVSLTLPGLEFDQGSHPKVDESSATLIRNNQGSERFDYVLSPWLDRLKVLQRNRSAYSSEGFKVIENNIDGLFDAATDGKSNQIFENIAGEQNMEKLAFVVEGIYGRWMTQMISFAGRVRSQNQSASHSYEGLIQIPGQRLQQDWRTKIVLQTMLAVLAVCAIAIRFLLPVMELLPHNPCTIYGMARLLAGSKLVESPIMLGPINEHTCVENAQSIDVLDKQVYSLKWWSANGEDGNRKGRYGIDMEPDSDV